MRKMSLSTRRWIAGGFLLGLCGLAGANLTAAAAAAPTWQPRAQMLRPDTMDRELTEALQQLDLTTPQQAQLQRILANTSRRLAEQRQIERSDLPALSNPGSPDFDQAVRVARNDAIARVNLAVQAERDLYAILTPAQRQRLPAVLRGIENRWLDRAARANSSGLGAAAVRR